LPPATADMEPLLSTPIRIIALTALLAGLAVPAPAQEWNRDIRVGNLVDYSGRTSVLGRKYGEGKADAVRYINAHGGINGLLIDLLTVDYAYVLPQAVNAYNDWMANGGVAAIQGWGMADVKGLKDLVTRDQVPYFSAGFDAERLATDTPPDSAADEGTPYHFFVGPSAVDGLYAMLEWAASDWQAGGHADKATYLHMGDGSEFAMLGKAPGEARAWDLGFQVYSSLRYGTPDENKTACQGLAAAGIDYAYLANTGDSNTRLIKTCREMGVTTRFMTNVWGFDEQMLDTLGTAADGVVWVMATAAWGEDVPGMALLRDIATWAGHEGPRSIHYIQGVCAVYFMKEAMERASFMPGGETGPNIRAGMYEQTAWAPLGLKGVCNPGTWMPGDHRGIDTIWVYMAHVGDDARSMERVYTASLSRPAPAVPQKADH